MPAKHKKRNILNDVDEKIEFSARPSTNQDSAKLKEEKVHNLDSMLAQLVLLDNVLEKKTKQNHRLKTENKNFIYKQLNPQTDLTTKESSQKIHSKKTKVPSKANIFQSKVNDLEKPCNDTFHTSKESYAIISRSSGDVRRSFTPRTLKKSLISLKNTQQGGLSLLVDQSDDDKKKNSNGDREETSHQQSRLYKSKKAIATFNQDPDSYTFESDGDELRKINMKDIIYVNRKLKNKRIRHNSEREFDLLSRNVIKNNVEGVNENATIITDRTRSSQKDEVSVTRLSADKNQWRNRTSSVIGDVKASKFSSINSDDAKKKPKNASDNEENYADRKISASNLLVAIELERTDPKAATGRKKLKKNIDPFLIEKHSINKDRKVKKMSKVEINEVPSRIIVVDNPSIKCKKYKPKTLKLSKSTQKLLHSENRHTKEKKKVLKEQKREKFSKEIPDSNTTKKPTSQKDKEINNNRNLIKDQSSSPLLKKLGRENEKDNSRGQISSVFSKLLRNSNEGRKLNSSHVSKSCKNLDYRQQKYVGTREETMITMHRNIENDSAGKLSPQFGLQNRHRFELADKTIAEESHNNEEKVLPLNEQSYLKTLRKSVNSHEWYTRNTTHNKSDLRTDYSSSSKAFRPQTRGKQGTNAGGRLCQSPYKHEQRTSSESESFSRSSTSRSSQNSLSSYSRSSSSCLYSNDSLPSHHNQDEYYSHYKQEESSSSDKVSDDMILPSSRLLPAPRPRQLKSVSTTSSFFGCSEYKNGINKKSEKMHFINEQLGHRYDANAAAEDENLTKAFAAEDYHSESHDEDTFKPRFGKRRVKRTNQSMVAEGEDGLSAWQHHLLIVASQRPATPSGNKNLFKEHPLKHLLGNLVEGSKQSEKRPQTISDIYSIHTTLSDTQNGTVKAAYRRSDGLRVVIKKLSKSGIYRFGQWYSKTVPLELQFLCTVNKAKCNGVVDLVEWHETRDAFLLVMIRPHPVVDLHEYLTKHKKIKESVARHIIRQLVNALDDCINVGILHRDVKLENLLLNPKTLETTLIDFGCGAFVQSGSYNEFSGTPEYYPPEWFHNRKYNAEPLTTWSIGVLLYALLCGTLPFRSAQDVKEKDIKKFPMNVSRKARDLVCNLLQKNPRDRLRLKHILCHPWLSVSGRNTSA